VAHGLGGRGEEMPAVLPGMVSIAQQLEVGLMHERGGLEGLIRRLLRHLERREPAKFRVHQGQQFTGGFGIAALYRVEDAGEFVQGSGQSGLVWVVAKLPGAIGAVTAEPAPGWAGASR